MKKKREIIPGISERKSEDSMKCPALRGRRKRGNKRSGHEALKEIYLFGSA